MRSISDAFDFMILTKSNFSKSVYQLIGGPFYKLKLGWTLQVAFIYFQELQLVMRHTDFLLLSETCNKIYWTVTHLRSAGLLNFRYK